MNICFQQSILMFQEKRVHLEDQVCMAKMVFRGYEVLLVPKDYLVLKVAQELPGILVRQVHQVTKGCLGL